MQSFSLSMTLSSNNDSVCLISLDMKPEEMQLLEINSSKGDIAWQFDIIKQSGSATAGNREDMQTDRPTDRPTY